MKSLFITTRTWLYAVAMLAALGIPTFFVGAAQFDANSGLQTFFRGVVTFIDGVLIPAILALAFLVFVWGVFLYFIKGGADDEAQSKGKSLMLYAIAGFVLILIFFGIVNLLANSIGFTDSDRTFETPGSGISL